MVDRVRETRPDKSDGQAELFTHTTTLSDRGTHLSLRDSCDGQGGKQEVNE